MRDLIHTQAIYVIWLRQIKRFIRARSRLIGNILQPFFFLTIFGFGFNRAIIPGIPEGMNYIDFLSPGIITMTVLFSSLFAGISVIFDKQFGFMQEILVAPVSRLSIIIGKILGGATTAIIQGFIVLSIALVLGVKISITGLILAIIFMILIAFSAVGFGLIVASRMEDIHGFQLIMNLLIFPLFFLSSAIFPIDGLPDFMKIVAMLNPLTYGVDGLRGSLIGVSRMPLIINLGVMSALSLIMVTLGNYFFRKSEI